MDFQNLLPLLLQVFVICGLSVGTLKMGEKALNSWLCLVAVGMNLFVTKQINLFGLHVTAAEALAVGYLLGLSLIQEFYGKKAARQHVYISMLVSIGFLLLSWVHVSYSPNEFDTMQPHFNIILTPLPRIVCASLTSFFVIQLCDIAFFQYLRRRTQGKWLLARTGTCLVLTQVLDTVLFSFLGLYGLVHDLSHVMVVSFIIKLCVIFLSLPFVEVASVFMKKPLVETTKGSANKGRRYECS